MKVLVTYNSESGNTRKLANTIFETLTTDKDICTIKEVRNAEKYDMIFVGFPIHKLGPSKKAKEFLENLETGKKVALFATHAMQAGNEMNNKQINNCKKSASKLDVLGIYSCQGELSEETAVKMLNSGIPQMHAFGKMRHNTIGHPNQNDLENLKIFTNDILQNLTM